VGDFSDQVRRKTGSARFGKGSDHILPSLRYAINPDAMKSYTDRLTALFAREGNAAFARSGAKTERH
jgi:hypothetical protein